MLSRLGQPLSRFLSKPTIVGDGLAERMRSAAVGLLGLTTAVGLGLVAFISYQGWPGVLSSPIPAPPTASRSAPGQEHASRRVVAPGGAGHRAPSAVEAASTRPRAGIGPGGLEVSGGRRAVSAPPQPATDGNPPSHQVVPGPTPTGQQPAAPTPPAQEPAPVPVATDSPTPARTTEKASHGHGQGHAYGREGGDHAPGHPSNPAKSHHLEPHAAPSTTSPPAPAPSPDSGQGTGGPPSPGQSGDHGKGHANGHHGG